MGLFPPRRRLPLRIFNEFLNGCMHGYLTGGGGRSSLRWGKMAGPVPSFLSARRAENKRGGGGGGAFFITSSTLEDLGPKKKFPLMSEYQVIFVLGGPGAGKGTQCANIVAKYGFVHLSAGDLLRAEQKKPGSEVGSLIEKHIVNGTIVPASVTCSLLKEAITSSKDSKKFLIDGFPRNEDNLAEWEKSVAPLVNFRFVLFFDCDEATCIQRCISRGAAGSGRSDDNIESLRIRCQVYHGSTMGIIRSYEKVNKVKRIDATQDIDAVFADVQKVFDQENF